ncbi:glutamate--cysteine ligase [Kitasatospora sp. NA04385]|uniref:carboxylate-amine ligase n=1 Tax=Kitasatospora sp. NA04385 TaxID=2742135 RepID=UPI001592845B|nr:glutamate--cysteine ligase [Kitasatospora sp. NA04385]QKW23263.1 glutamate--cysteine ligase [Kitasatospora sp. NA04385]
MLTVGVEEEYLLLDAATGVPVARAEQVRQTAGLQPAIDRSEVQRELLQAQLEIATPVCETLDEVAAHLERLRGALAAAAAEHGCRLAACGAAPFADRLAVPVSDTPRYRTIRAEAPQLTDEQLINGMHVHTAVPDRGAGVAVLNGLRRWLPLLVALSANSPLWNGTDTGFADWRTVVFSRWPISGVPPRFDGAADYDERIHALVDTGLVGDTGGLYWQARLSERYPTVETRAMDVQLRVDEAVMLAGLVRAITATLLTDPGRAAAPPEPHPEALAAAVWYAARRGCTERLPDPLTGTLDSPPVVVDRVLDALGPALRRNGDAQWVEPLLARLLTEGNGAVRQRRELRRNGRAGLVDLISAVTDGTPSGSPATSSGSPATPSGNAVTDGTPSEPVGDPAG